MLLAATCGLILLRIVHNIIFELGSSVLPLGSCQEHAQGADREHPLQDRIYPMMKSKDEEESINYRFIVSLNEENFQFSKWVSAPVVNKSLKRPRSRGQKCASAPGLRFSSVQSLPVPMLF